MSMCMPLSLVGTMVTSWCLSRAFVGVEAAHIATLIGDRGTVFAFGALPVQIRQLNQRIFTLGLNSILDYKT